MQSVNFLFTNGKAAVFQFGKFMTDNPDEAAALDAEIKNGHPHIYRPANESERTVQSDALDPMSMLRAKLRAEIIAEERAINAAAVNPANNMGTSAAGPVVPSGSNDFSEMTQLPGTKGMAGDSLAKLVNLPVAAGFATVKA